jgi:hypothetical protein
MVEADYRKTRRCRSFNAEWFIGRVGSAVLSCHKKLTQTECKFFIKRNMPKLVFKFGSRDGFKDRRQSVSI